MGYMFSAEWQSSTVLPDSQKRANHHCLEKERGLSILKTSEVAHIHCVLCKMAANLFHPAAQTAENCTLRVYTSCLQLTNTLCSTCWHSADLHNPWSPTPATKA